MYNNYTSIFLKQGKQPLNKPTKQQQQKNLYSSRFHFPYLLTLENCTGKSFLYLNLHVWVLCALFYSEQDHLLMTS